MLYPSKMATKKTILISRQFDFGQNVEKKKD